MCTLSILKKELSAQENPEKAKILQRFFKTGAGEYGEGDVFLGVAVPHVRKIAKKYNELALLDIVDLLHSKIHEERLASLLIMVDKFQKGKEKEAVYRTYLQNTKYINSWDLVDLSAYKIVGEYLSGKPKAILYQLARSKMLWERRIAIIATFSFIKNNQFEETFAIARILVDDEHDLIQKAVGWMLREIGKRDYKAEEEFLDKYADKMARTTLRYAIEKFPEEKRKHYLARGFYNRK
ncbi:DNA alkylation repair protein [Candidatus Aerophobetes bacterium]|nr:DNA alkylation repair protein [Candidatus Aerophobetes bacterium]